MFGSLLRGDSLWARPAELTPNFGSLCGAFPRLSSSKHISLLIIAAKAGIVKGFAGKNKRRFL
jgi:hypothetical protein